MAIGERTENVRDGNPKGLDLADGDSTHAGSHDVVSTKTSTTAPAPQHAPIKSVAFDESVQGFQLDAQPSASGADLMAVVVGLLHQSRIQCCCVSEAALIYYGAHRKMLVGYLELEALLAA